MSELAGKGCEIIVPFDERQPLKDIERSIIKKYRKHLWSKFIKAIRDYNLVEEGDKIAVAISGGKDSLLMAKMFQELKRHGQVNFEVEFICNKLALGHHYDDVIETTMLNLLCAGNFKTMLPKLNSTNFDGIQIIRPLYYIREEHIVRFIQNSGIWPLNCACMVAAKKTGNKRYEIKDLIKSLGENFKDVEKSIFKAAENVNIDSVLGWQQDGVKHSFLENYEK